MPTNLRLRLADTGGSLTDDLKVLSPVLCEAVEANAIDPTVKIGGPDLHRPPGTALLGYRVIGQYERHPWSSRLNASDALIITRFMLDEVDDGMSRVLGRNCCGIGILNLSLCGLEMCWNSDLIQALERRAPIYSRATIHYPDGDVEIEHLVMLEGSYGSGPVLRGWFNPLHGARITGPIMQDGVRITRVERGRPVSVPVVAENAAAIKGAQIEDWASEVSLSTLQKAETT
ncbi:hypothetical protein FGK63_02820 [Ruegeria sediminis]|uniref:Uncharacterized protein n=1 Tax=Ruegeria sediminis TaxID=2583820 RepID=A0ABY2X3P6_9RHOB|nr:hypothetical protein [Ruegeria sediminis]TMV10012.1 hypothetical protein FGK63_02820 [Ruegeria sediminis]